MLDKSTIEKEIALPVNEISIIKLVDDIISYAYELRASDVHIDPAETTVKVRYRVDGVMQSAFSLPKEIQEEIISRIKVLSGLRTDEHHAAQDGRIKFTGGKDGDKFDIRVSITPTYYEENCVLRLLAERGQSFSLETIGFSDKDLKTVSKALKKPYGMILATGPTGSGKTTTLYSILKILNTEARAIITIEDPIEFSLEGVNQIPVNSQTGLTFATGLRSILRQDPNVIMVGEIRDQETAKIAVNAALTGHLLLSTLHTNDAGTTLPRLLDMGVEPFLIASTVNIAISQRLVRTICKDCKVKRKLTLKEIESLGEILSPEFIENKKSVDFYLGKGCPACLNTGYKGRIGIHEVLEVTELIRGGIMQRATAAEIKKLAVKEGMVSMVEDGFDKALKGITTIEEILRVTRE